MLSQTEIQLKAQQYLKHFQHSHQQKKTLLKQLEFKVNFAARKIQKSWRVYQLRKKNIYARKIQCVWRRYKRRLYGEREKIRRFREIFYKGKIGYFILEKYFRQKHLSNQVNSITTPIPHHKKYSLHTFLLKSFPPFIHLQQTYSAECSYIQKLRIYQKQKFSQQWQKYEQILKNQLHKQATKKWVKKNQSIWITQQNKQINLQQYIEKHVEKIFERQYNKFRENDQKLEGTVNVLREKMKQFAVLYYRGMLDQQSV